jgi:haloalkane dehalogenase
MHYIDEGPSAYDGLPIVFCHGNPTWSYLYRNIIKALRPNHRCIAYDLPGFGFSDHPNNYSYTPQEHAQWVESFLFEHLKLDKFIMVVQDWGGPIGLSIATRHPEKIAGLVISSTWAWKPNTIATLFSKLMATRLFQYLTMEKNFFATRLVAMMLGKTATPDMLAAYAAPFPTPESRKGTAVFPVQITKATPWLEEIHRCLPRLSSIPVEFIFGLKDLMTKPADMKRWTDLFPNAGVQKVPDANHYTQEDTPESYVKALEKLLTICR